MGNWSLRNDESFESDESVFVQKTALRGVKFSNEQHGTSHAVFCFTGRLAPFRYVFD
jgi:hypothetical protein